MVALAIAWFVFVATHFAMSHPLRDGLVARLGPRGFLSLYSLVALVEFAWVIVAFRRAPAGNDLWATSETMWTVGAVVMLVASVLLAGSMIGNPALPDPTGRTLNPPVARGVFAITRHPMMWSFVLWALVHFAVSPRPAVFVSSVAVIVLSLGGAMGQDRKKERLIGTPWRDWMARTAFVPFAGQVSGRIDWPAAAPGWIATLGGLALWLVVTFVHPILGSIPPVGPWRWLY